MKDLLGSPGTVTGLLLRIGQSLFAAGSIGVMVSALGFSNFTAYCDYDCSIEYHPGKANVVANALSRNVPLSALSGQATEGVEVMFANLTLRPQLLSQIREAQSFDEDLKKLREVVGREGKEDFSTDSEGVLLFKGRLCVPNQGDLQTELLKTAHKSRFSIHPGGSKIPVARRRVLKLRFGFWSGNMVEKSEKKTP